MYDDDPPLIGLPHDLSDEAAAQILEFLHELTTVFENYYAAQLRRYYHTPDTDTDQLTLWNDPPF